MKQVVEEVLKKQMSLNNWWLTCGLGEGQLFALAGCLINFNVLFL